MRLSKSRVIAAKDFKTYRKKRNVIYSLAVIPFLVAILITAVILYAGRRSTSRLAPAELTLLLPAFLFFYAIRAETVGAVRDVFRAISRQEARPSSIRAPIILASTASEFIA